MFVLRVPYTPIEWERGRRDTHAARECVDAAAASNPHTFSRTHTVTCTQQAAALLQSVIPLVKMSKKQAPLSNYFGVPPPPKKRQTEPPPEQHKKRVFTEKWLEDVG